MLKSDAELIAVLTNKQADPPPSAPFCLSQLQIFEYLSIRTIIPVIDMKHLGLSYTHTVCIVG